MDELNHWFSGSRSPKVDADVQLAHLHRVSVKRVQWPELCVMAFDHRAQFLDMARQAGADESRVPVLKQLLVRAAEQAEIDHDLKGRFGVLIDGTDYGTDALPAATGRGWWVGRPVELPGSRPLRFDGGPSLATTLGNWPSEHVVKCLVHYHPDDAHALRVEQEARITELWTATRASGHELLLEIIPPKGISEADADEAVVRAVKRLYNLGFKPEWWKLAPLSAAAWDQIGALVQERDPYCRGAVILGLNQPLADLARGFAEARHPVVKGFMVGRTLWADPSLAWFKGELDDAGFIAAVSHNFAELVQAWNRRDALRRAAA